MRCGDVERREGNADFAETLAFESRIISIEILCLISIAFETQAV